MESPVITFSMFKYAHGATKLGTILALFMTYYSTMALVNRKEVRHFPFLLVPKLTQLRGNVGANVVCYNVHKPRFSYVNLRWQVY